MRHSAVRLPPPTEKEENLADLLSTCLKPDGRLVLVKRGHPDACVFKHRPCTEPEVLELSSHPGMTIGLLNEEPIDYTDWLVYTLGVVPHVRGGLAAGFDGTFIFAQHHRQDCVFDIAGGNMTELNVLWLLRAAVSTMTTREPFAARTFTINEDLTCSPKTAPNLVSSPLSMSPAHTAEAIPLGHRPHSE